MLEPPTDLTDAEVLAAVRSAWDGAATTVEHLTVGFGAHHWRVDVDGVPRLFVTYDRFGTRHTAETLESAYEGAIRLAEGGLEFVLAPLRTGSGRVLVPISAGALSCTPWVEGRVVGEGSITDADTARTNITDLARLHASAPPPGLTSWAPLVEPDFADRLAARVAPPDWATGPYGGPARRAVAARLPEIEGWTRRYLRLAAASVQRHRVVTHGETHTRNQLRTADGIRFVDWESLELAPRERDLSTLVQAGYGERVGADPAMLELFDIEWRLSEIDEYVDWFANPHAGTPDDRIAYDGLLDELQRAPWWPN